VRVAVRYFPLLKLGLRQITDHTVLTYRTEQYCVQLGTGVNYLKCKKLNPAEDRFEERGDSAEKGHTPTQAHRDSRGLQEGDTERERETPGGSQSYRG